MKVDHRSIIFG